MAVTSAARGARAGSLLLDYLLNGLAGEGVQVIGARSSIGVPASAPPDAATRAFWERTWLHPG